MIYDSIAKINGTASMESDSRQEKHPSYSMSYILYILCSNGAFVVSCKAFI